MGAAALVFTSLNLGGIRLLGSASTVMQTRVPHVSGDIVTPMLAVLLRRDGSA
jgi:hypothetical protein